MATRTAFAVGSGRLWGSPAPIDGLLAYAVAMAVGVAVFTSSVGSQPWPAYVFALGFGLILLIRRRYPVLVLIITSLGICVYYTLQYPPIGLALPIAAALFSAAEAGRLRISIIVSVILVGLAVYFQIIAGRDIGQLLGYELPPVIALMGASLALGDGVRSRRLLKGLSAGAGAPGQAGAGASRDRPAKRRAATARSRPTRLARPHRRNDLAAVCSGRRSVAGAGA